MWSSAKSLRGLILDVLCNGKNSRVLELETTLDASRNMFAHILRFPTKSAEHRLAIKQSMVEPVSLPDFPQRILLTQEFVDEVIILSDLFELDELLALELLLTAESQKLSNPTVSVSLLSVTLFFDAKLALVECLRTLLQARNGRTWSPEVSSDVTEVVQMFTSGLWKDNLLGTILSALRVTDATKEFERLDRLNALGDSKHRQNVFILLNDIQAALAECLLLWACQSAFTVAEFSLVLDHIFVERTELAKSSSNAVDYPPNSDFNVVQLHLFMSLLYSLDPFSISTTGVDQISDLGPFELAHPLFSDNAFVTSVGKFLDSQKDQYDQRTEGGFSDHLCLLAVLRLAWAICLRRSAHLRAELSRQYHVHHSPTGSPDRGRSCEYENTIDGGLNAVAIDEDDEIHASMAIESGALEFIRKRLLPVVGFDREPLWICRIHNLLTDLIVHMPGRIKEIRLKDEDLLRRTRFDPSSTGSGFANMILLIAQLYNQPGSPLHARLALEYWRPAAEHASCPGLGTTSGDLLFLGGVPSPSQFTSAYGAAAVLSKDLEADNLRQAALFRFLRSAGDLVTSPCLFLPYLYMLHGLVCSRTAGRLCFSLLKANTANSSRAASLISWDHFFASFRKYLNHMKQPIIAQQARPHASSNSLHRLYPHLYGPDPANRFSLQHPSTALPCQQSTQTIQPDEEAGLQAVLRLTARICRVDPLSRSAFAYSVDWELIPTCLGLLTCPVSLHLKADILHLLTSLSYDPSVASYIWRSLCSSGILPMTRPSNVASYAQQPACGLHTELEEVEPRAEEYPVTQAFIALLNLLSPHIDSVYYHQQRAKSVGTDGTGDPTAVIQSDDSVKVSTASLSYSPSSLVSVISFVTNSVFLKHTMRAYRNPDERWDIAAACLVLFDGFIDQFVRRLDAIVSAVVSVQTPDSKQPDIFLMDNRVTSSGVFGTPIDSSSSLSNSDWAATVIQVLMELVWQQPVEGSNSSARFRQSSNSPMAQLIDRLKLPSNWPLSDPGYHLTVQFLIDSSLFRTLTGLLEVGLHSLLTLPLINGPAIGMTRSTAAGLHLIKRLLINEDILITFVRRMFTTAVPLLSTDTGSTNVSYMRSGGLSSFPNAGVNALPVCLSRLLMSINSRTGRADLLSTILRYCNLANELPEHCLCALDILGCLVGRIKPHSNLVALLTVDTDMRRELLCSLTSLLKLPNQDTLGSSTSCALLRNQLQLDELTAYSDEWMFADSNAVHFQLVCLGSSSMHLPHSASQLARLLAGVPFQSPGWSFPSQQWELWSCWPRTRSSVLSPLSHTDLPMNDSSSLISLRATTLGEWLCAFTTGCNADSLCMRLLHILLASLNQPAPNLSHWLLGFRIESSSSVSRSTLQDAGIGDQPRTCLHAMFELIEYAFRLGPSGSSFLPANQVFTLQWNLAIVWQILYRLSADQSVTSEPFLRFLRNTPDFLTKHILRSLREPIAPNAGGTEGLELTDAPDSFKTVLDFLSLNQNNWLLRILAIEMRNAVFSNRRSYVTKMLRLIFDDLLLEHAKTTNSDNISSVVYTFLRRIKASELKSGPYSFDLHCVDGRTIDKILSLCEFNCPLLASDSAAVRKMSRITSPQLFLNKLYLNLLMYPNNAFAVGADSDVVGFFVWCINRGPWSTTHNSSVSRGSIDDSSPMADVCRLRRWVEARNLHCLQLYAGKHAAVEAWRQLVEISMGTLISGSYTNMILSSTACSFRSPPQTNIFGRLSTQPYLNDRTHLRPIQLVCLEILDHILSEFSVIDSASSSPPPSLRLLSSGTTLMLSSFLLCQCLTSVTALASDGCRLDTAQLIPALLNVVRQLSKMILDTKPSAQRMRANFYGTLCFLLRFAHYLNGLVVQDSSSTFTSHYATSECLSCIQNASASSSSAHWSQFKQQPNQFLTTGTLKESAELTPFQIILSWDMLRGHPITQMAALSLFERLCSIERTLGKLTVFLCQPGTIQHLVDTIPEDLSSIESFMVTTSTANGTNSTPGMNAMPKSSMEATSAYHMYRSKMSLLCRIASVNTGAKMLLQLDTINCLANCGVFSASNLADCFSDGLELLLFQADNAFGITNTSDTAGLNCMYLSLSSLMDSALNGQDSDEYLFHTVLESFGGISADAVPRRSEFECEYGFAANDVLSSNEGVSWSGALLPAVRLASIILTSMGPSHLSSSQQVFNFVYLHANALLDNEQALGHTLMTFLNSPDALTSLSSSNTATVELAWLSHWISAEMSLCNLFVQLFRSQTACRLQALDEYSALQREVVQSRILRHVTGLLPALVINSSPEPSEFNASVIRGSNIRIGFQRFLCQTQHVHLLNQLLSICVASLGAVDSVMLRTGQTDSFGGIGNSGSYRPFFATSPFLSQLDDMDQSQLSWPGILFQVLKWGLGQLGHIEQMCLNLITIGIFGQPSGSSDPVEDQQTRQPVLFLLNFHSLSSDVPVDEMRQGLTSLFSCSSQSFSSNSDFTIGVDGHRRETLLLSRLLTVGIRLLRLQLRTLIVLIEKATYLIWCCLNHYLNISEPITTETLGMDRMASTEAVRRPSLRRLQDPSSTAPVRTVKQSMPSAPAAATTTPFKKELTQLNEQLPKLLTSDLLEALNRCAKMSYLVPNQRLFLQVMQHRLERFLPKTRQQLSV